LAIKRRKEKMSPAELERFEDMCSKLRADYEKILDYIVWYAKDGFTNPKHGLVSKMLRQGRLWSETNPEGMKELYFRWIPRLDIMYQFEFLVGEEGKKPKYQKPDDFHFHFNTLADGGVWKTNRSGEEFFDNQLFLAAFQTERISVPDGVSPFAVLAKRALASSFIKVTDVSDKKVSDKDVLEFRFYYKDACQVQKTPSQEGAGAGAGSSDDAEDDEAVVDDAEDDAEDDEAVVDDAEDDADSDDEAAVDDAEDDADSDDEAAVDDAEDDADSDDEAAVDA
jgi:hypothetical protein